MGRDRATSQAARATGPISGPEATRPSEGWKGAAGPGGVAFAAGGAGAQAVRSAAAMSASPTSAHIGGGYAAASSVRERPSAS